MITRINEATAKDGNEVVRQKMDELVDFLKEDGVGIDSVNYNNKTIYVKTDKDLDEASWQVKHFWRDATQLGIQIAKRLNIPGLNRILPSPAMMDESQTLNEKGSTIPNIKRIPKDVDVVYEYVIRDLFKMKKVGSDSNTSYYVGKLNSNQFVAVVVPRSQKPTFYVFSNLTNDELDDMITLLSTTGADYMWDSFVDDYAGFPASFWEFVQEWQ